MTIRYSRVGDFFYKAHDAETGALVGHVTAAVYGDQLVPQGIDVDLAHLGKGIGTRLYEMLLNDACDAGAPLTSSNMRSVFSEAFWRKQARKGRAVCLYKGSGELYQTPVASLRQFFFNECRKERWDAAWAEDCSRRKLKAVLARMPKPKMGKTGVYWPCGQWQIPLTKCRGARSLAGLARARRRR